MFTSITLPNGSNSSLHTRLAAWLAASEALARAEQCASDWRATCPELVHAQVVNPVPQSWLPVERRDPRLHVLGLYAAPPDAQHPHGQPLVVVAFQPGGACICAGQCCGRCCRLQLWDCNHFPLTGEELCHSLELAFGLPLSPSTDFPPLDVRDSGWPGAMAGGAMAGGAMAGPTSNGDSASGDNGGDNGQSGKGPGDNGPGDNGQSGNGPSNNGPSKKGPGGNQGSGWGNNGAMLPENAWLAAEIEALADPNDNAELFPDWLERRRTRVGRMDLQYPRRSFDRAAERIVNNLKRRRRQQ